MIKIVSRETILDIYMTEIKSVVLNKTSVDIMCISIQLNFSEEG